MLTITYATAVIPVSIRAPSVCVPKTRNSTSGIRIEKIISRLLRTIRRRSKRR
jgi:hypothetical protein